VYDWLSLYKASLENPNVDLADYISPSLVITETSDTGRQYTAKRAIKRGELLLMVKPFAVTKADVKKKAQRLVYANLHNDSPEWPTKALLTHRISWRCDPFLLQSPCDPTLPLKAVLTSPFCFPLHQTARRPLNSGLLLPARPRRASPPT
jgi:hypothetical protein